MQGVPNDGFEENPLYSVLNITRVSLRQSCLIFNFPRKKNTRSSPPASKILKLSDSQPTLDFEVVNEQAAFKFVTQLASVKESSPKFCQHVRIYLFCQPATN